MDKTLGEIFTHYNSDKDTSHSYGAFYDEILLPYKDTAKCVLEVGVFRGASLQAWQEWFTQAQIIGLDDGVSWGLWEPAEEGRIKVIQVDAYNPGRLARAVLPYRPDVVIDDGGHNPYGQIATWSTLCHYVAPGGIYIIEDIRDLKVANDMAEMCKDFQVVNRTHIKNREDDILLVWRPSV